MRCVMTLDEELASRGMITIAERLKCDGPMDSFMRHAGVETLDDLLAWVVMERKQYLEMTARHEMGLYRLCADTEEFIYGRCASLWGMHVNLLHVMRGLQNDKG